MLSVFISLSQTFIDSGFYTALVRKQERTQIDKSTIFFFNIFVSVLLYFVLFVSAPYISDFYDTPALVCLTRVLCIGLVLSSLVGVHRILFTIELDFKTIAKISLLGTIISGGLGIFLAIKGWGYWAIVFQQLISQFIDIILYWSLSKWRPSFLFSYESIKEMFAFSFKILGSSIIACIYNNIYPLIIGRVYSAESLGFFNRAQSLTFLVSTNLTGILKTVTYPILCKIQENEELLKDTFIRIMRLSAYVIFPIMLGLAALSEPFILSLLGEKWSNSILILQILCFAFIWEPILAINLNIFLVKGKSNLLFYINILQQCLVLLVVLFTIKSSISAMCYGYVYVTTFIMLLGTCFAVRTLKIGIWKILICVMPSLILSVAMAFFILLLNRLIDSYIYQLILGGFAGFCFYLISSILLKLEEYKELISIIKRH